ncbi:LacI family DNA-binding transcriptional regulator [Rhizobium sophorae]|uniref:LacI family DNA-binding transcriptional regulator n=2 Tax=Rhizobium TaxID=379 RepID=A0A7Z0ZU62_9HYPH|nr:LacI family DNA-binding transcriptional regulator [Rhizobium sophorae]MBX4861728.1 LacI family DNA-binding transcriptional regulator [Rhizobium bangladeshense]NKK69952.1 LacI family DNA-binding transcriptional regulator [Rhizobium leguminosarum bv. viciae]NNU38326.1 LacI family DNA-binding transcriptional regulator [Rhizobium sophorae]NZD64327.1 LacI family DNA-binding transcriptional regulator [Rhizobium changzhiense]
MSNSTPATIEDVARIAEVSIATVSRAIHMPEKVANSTRLKVNQAIAITGYTTNAMARSLRLGRSNMILVVAPDIGDPNFSNILVGLENEARAHGYGILIGHTQNDAQRGLEYLKFLNSNQAAGLILFTGILPFGHQTMTARLPPSVGVFEPVFNGGIPYVGVDDTEGARKAVDLLLAEGHRKIAFIGDSRTRLAYTRRRMGYDAGLDAAGISPDNRIVLEGDGTIESGRHAVEQLFMRDTLPTAFMCVNDQTAIGVMVGLGARGYDIPRDFSVTGFDDVPQAVFISPPLTTIRQPRTAIGKQAMALLLELLSDGRPTETEILLRPDLVVRNSVSAPSRNWSKR